MKPTCRSQSENLEPTDIAAKPFCGMRVVYWDNGAREKADHDIPAQSDAV
jgi:hypothetical protein